MVAISALSGGLGSVAAHTRPVEPGQQGTAARRRAPGADDAQDGPASRPFSSNNLSAEETRIVQALKARDAEVRRHEQAHAAAAGPHGGAPRYDYQKGPDGRLYAVGGEVSIDASPAASPEATIRKMRVVIRAAEAPIDPSAQDRTVAAQARQALTQAQAEARQERREETEDRGARSTDEALPTRPADAARAYAMAAGALSRPGTRVNFVIGAT